MQTILATLLVIGAIFSINIEPIDNAQLIEHLDARIRDASSLSKIAKNESIKQVREAEVKEASEIAPFFTIQKDLTEYFKRNILTSSFTGGFLFNTNTFIDKESYCFWINQNGGIIIFNIWKKDYDRTNSNMVIVGSSGSGKWVAGQWDSRIFTTENKNNVGMLLRRLVNYNTGEKITVFCGEHFINSPTGTIETSEHSVLNTPTIKRACKVAYFRMV